MKLPKSAPSVKTKVLQERRRKQILATRAARPKKIKTGKKVTPAAVAKPAKATKPAEKAAAKSGAEKAPSVTK